MFGTHHVQHCAGIDARGHAEADPRGEIRLDQAGDDIHARPLCRQHQVHAHGARHLGQASDALLHVGALQHHQVGQFVDHDQNVGKMLQLFLFELFLEEIARLRFQLPHLLVELFDIADALAGQQFQAALHFEHSVAQRDGGFAGSVITGVSRCGIPS